MASELKRGRGRPKKNLDQQRNLFQSPDQNSISMEDDF